MGEGGEGDHSRLYRRWILERGSTELKTVFRRVNAEFSRRLPVKRRPGILTTISGLSMTLGELSTGQEASNLHSQAYEAEKFARNRIAQRLYYWGRLCLGA